MNAVEIESAISELALQPPILLTPRLLALRDDGCVVMRHLALDTTLAAFRTMPTIYLRYPHAALDAELVPQPAAQAAPHPFQNSP